MRFMAFSGSRQRPITSVWNKSLVKLRVKLRERTVAHKKLSFFCLRSVIEIIVRNALWDMK